jgi:hypothetical protein
MFQVEMHMYLQTILTYWKTFGFIVTPIIYCMHFLLSKIVENNKCDTCIATVTVFSL